MVIVMIFLVFWLVLCDCYVGCVLIRCGLLLIGVFVLG